MTFRTRIAVGRLVLAVLPLTLIACGGGSQEDDPGGGAGGWIRDDELAVVEIVVDLAGAHDGRIPVEVTAKNGRPTHFAIQSAWADGYRFHDVRFTDGSGNSIQHDETSGRYRVPRTDDKVVVLRYEAELGGAGRHGDQGAVAEDHAIFDGRLFLLPQGAVPIGSARIRFVTPEGWTVASPYREDGSWHYVDAFDPELTAKVLGATCIGVGTFDHSVRRIGAMEVRVASYANWSAEHRRQLDDKTFRVLGYFHDTLGFDLEAPYSVVWVPALERQRVFGGSFANGTCFEHPTDRQRNWELLSHRVAHSMNEYRPSGMRVRDERDRWFTEGWASYMEANATEALGLADTNSRWNVIHASYKRVRRRIPERDRALSREADSRDETREYLHYVKAPLAMKMLERLIVARSDSTLERFMAAMWSDYGWFRKPFPFKEALESYTGASYDDFWASMVDRPGFVVPVWEAYLTPDRRARMSQAPAAWVAGEPVQGDYLFHLAWSGDFKSFEAIRRFVGQASMRRRELAEAGVQLVPEEIRDHLFALDADDRYALARLERSYPLHLVADGAAHGNDAGSREAPAVEANDGQEDGRIFAELLKRERERVTAGSPTSSARIYLRTVESASLRASPARLGFEAGTKLDVAVSAAADAEPAEIEVVSGGRATTRRALEAGSGSQLEATLPPADRPAGSRVIVLRVVSAGGDLAGAPLSRAYWQRAGAARLPEQP